MNLDRERIGKDVRKQREKYRKTIERLAADIGEDKISTKTILRIEHGDPSVSKEKLGIVIHALGMDPFAYFTGEDIFYACLDDPQLEARLDAQKILFPADALGVSRYRIRTLAEFLRYLPLMDHDNLLSLLKKTECRFDGNEELIADGLQELYDGIPAGPEKDWADHLCEAESMQTRNLLVSSRAKVAKQEFNERSSSEDAVRGKERFKAKLMDL